MEKIFTKPLTKDQAEGDWVEIDEFVRFNRKAPLGNNVFRGQFRYKGTSPINVAVKFINKSCRTRREADILQQLKHQNVIKLEWHGECKKQEHDYFLALELCEKNLEVFRDEFPDHCQEKCDKIILAIIEGLKHTHGKGILHRDLNPSNILVNKGHHFVIADFDMSKKSDNVHQPTSCSMGFDGYFCAPELLEGQNHSVKADAYSAGGILFWLITKGKHATEHRHADGKTEVSGEPKTHLIDISFCHEYELARDLINKLLKVDPDLRIDLRDIENHPFFLSDDDKIRFFQEFYTEVEQLPNTLQGTKHDKRNIKHHLHQPAQDICGENWLQELILDDEEQLKCFPSHVDSKNEMRHAIHNFAQPRGPNPYMGESSFSLVRLIRNLATHEKGHNKYIQTILNKCGRWRFFSKRFPKLFLHVWDAVMSGHFHDVKRLKFRYISASSKKPEQNSQVNSDKQHDKPSSSCRQPPQGNNFGPVGAPSRTSEQSSSEQPHESVLLAIDSVDAMESEDRSTGVKKLKYMDENLRLHMNMNRLQKQATSDRETEISTSSSLSSHVISSDANKSLLGIIGQTRFKEAQQADDVRNSFNTASNEDARVPEHEMGKKTHDDRRWQASSPVLTSRNVEEELKTLMRRPLEQNAPDIRARHRAFNDEHDWIQRNSNSNSGNQNDAIFIESMRGNVCIGGKNATRVHIKKLVGDIQVGGSRGLATSSTASNQRGEENTSKVLKTSSRM